jgi:hypothetical protein
MATLDSTKNPDRFGKVLESMQALTIMQYIKENENNDIGITKDSVAKAMHEKGVCSRTTTLKIIDSLLQAGVLLDQRRKRNEFHDLVVNKDIDIKRLVRKKFQDHVEEIKKGAEPLESLIEDEKFRRKIKDSVIRIEKVVSDI